MPTRLWDSDLPLADELPDRPRGVVLHWTGGGPTANSVDLGAYHFVVEHDGRVRAGSWPVAANMCRVGGSNYAMHTGGFNSYRIGISGAGMMDYKSPEDPGPYPLTEVQVGRMTELAAYFLDLAEADPRDPVRLCTHREVWTLHAIKGTRNHLKKDIEFLPFRPELSPAEVGDHLRDLTWRALLERRGEAILDTVLDAAPGPHMVVPAPSIPHDQPSFWARGRDRLQMLWPWGDRDSRG